MLQFILRPHYKSYHAVLHFHSFYNLVSCHNIKEVGRGRGLGGSHFSCKVRYNTGTPHRCMKPETSAYENTKSKYVHTCEVQIKELKVRFGIFHAAVKHNRETLKANKIILHR